MTAGESHVCLEFTRVLVRSAGQAVVCPLLRGRSPPRGVAPKQHWGLRRAVSPAFGPRSPFPLARGFLRNQARRNYGLLASAARFCSSGSGRLGGAAAGGRTM